MEKAILTQQELQSNLERFATFYSSQTNKGTYRTTGRNSLLKDSLGTRANSIWKMAEYIVATYENSDKPIQAYLDGWHALAKNFRDQFLFLEIEPNTWNLYDWSGKLLNETIPISDFFRLKESEHKKIDTEKLADSLNQLLFNKQTSEIVIEDSTLKQFAYKFFKYLYDLDRFSAFWTAASNGTGWNDAIFRTIKDSEKGIYLSGFLRADKNDDGQYFPNGFELDGHTWYLSTNWCKQEFVPDTNNRYGLSAIGMQRLIEYYYPSYTMEISDRGYRLIRTVPPTKSFESKILPKFWNHVGQIVLEIDEDFSKLPRYYHKGHIRVRTNYGGACNFSIGYYDPENGRVNKDVTFQFDGKSQGQIFYLDIETKDPKAFAKFIPVFNNTYQGLFEISIEGDKYSFLDLREVPSEPYRSSKRRQVIYFGAPGTGKSFEVNRIVTAEAPKRNIRTTFHPDTDYSSFVGCYKPTMRDGQIEYAFTAQAFINAYIGAWSDLSKPFYLVIEEINRGNCAQIFGDIFQLLDRNADGESNYSIKPDTDLQNYIENKLGLISNIPEEIRSGEQMRLPSNLFIYATMNTSDQSLFPIDSAFKRRWDMRYTAIKPGEKDHILVVGGHRYNWTSFIRKVNEKIFDLTKSEDKQLGYWFISPDSNNEIDWELFVSKAIFYIWNDVVKDYATMEKEDSPFGKKFAFTTFYNEHGEPIIEQTVAFLDKLEVEKLPAFTPDSPIYDISDSDLASEPITEYSDEDSSDEDGDNQDGTGRDNTKYQINGSGKISKKNLAYELIKKYIQDHPEESAFEVVKAWKSLGDLVSHFVELQEEFDKRTDINPRVEMIECNGEKIYVSTNGWGGKAKMQELISAVESKEWGLNITEYPA